MNRRRGTLNEIYKRKKPIWKGQEAFYWMLHATGHRACPQEPAMAVPTAWPVLFHPSAKPAMILSQQ